MHISITKHALSGRDHFLKSGYMVLRKAFPEQVLDQYSTELSAFLLRNPEINAAKEGGERHPEVTARRHALQWLSAGVLQLAMDERITGVLRTLLMEEPFLLQVGTLSNDNGTRRNFLTQGSIASHINAWIALKDVRSECGSLWVVPESHHFTGNYFEQLLTAQPELAARLIIMRESGAEIEAWRELERCFDEASDALLDRYIDRHRLTRVPLMLQRGDVVIFSEHLIHGRLNSVIENGTRWCLVARYGAFSHPRSRYFDSAGDHDN